MVRSPLLDLIVKEGFEAALLPLGFKPTGRRLTWSRPANELSHVIGLLPNRKRYTIQWSVGCPSAARLLWGDGDVSDVGYTVMAGVPSNILKPTFGNSFEILEDITAESVHASAAAIASDVAGIAASLDRFQTRHGLWRYLMTNKDPVDHRDFTFPAMFTMKIATAAALALAGGDREGCEFMPEVRIALTKFKDKLARERLARLEDAAQRVCA
jgi:hypothetical protein